MERLQELKAKLPLIEEKISEKRSRERTKEIAKAQTELLRVKRELDVSDTHLTHFVIKLQLL